MKPVSWQRVASILVASALTTVPLGASTADAGKPGPLAIQEQGSFAVGGTVRTEPGTFDPAKPSPAGQTFRGGPACPRATAA